MLTNILLQQTQTLTSLFSDEPFDFLWKLNISHKGRSFLIKMNLQELHAWFGYCGPMRTYINPVGLHKYNKHITDIYIKKNQSFCIATGNVNIYLYIYIYILNDVQDMVEKILDIKPCLVHLTWSTWNEYVYITSKMTYSLVILKICYVDVLKDKDKI